MIKASVTLNKYSDGSKLDVNAVFFLQILTVFRFFKLS